MRSLRRGFTLVELLVVIGIIGVLVSILLPTLAGARRAATTIACAANLRSIGQGMAAYLVESRGVFPPSNYYKGLQIGATGLQTPTEPNYGYVHWTSFLYARKDAQVLGSNGSDPYGSDAPFLHATGWDMFRCPALTNGGLPPANTFTGNNDGLPNETPGVIDWQAPRLAYTINEALCPRGIFQLQFDSRGNVRVYRFVKISQVVHNSETILATELWGSQSAATTASLVGGADFVSNSRRPVNGVSYLSKGIAPDKAYQLPYGNNYVAATTADMSTDPESQLQPGASVRTNLDFVGRNHGARKWGSVAGDSRIGWDLRQSNFLYVDGHVETKLISQTVYPKSQWGEEYNLPGDTTNYIHFPSLEQ